MWLPEMVRFGSPMRSTIALPWCVILRSVGTPGSAVTDVIVMGVTRSNPFGHVASTPTCSQAKWSGT